jgi:uracil phosphoribosyltransferase
MENVFPSTHPLVHHKLTRLRDQNTEPKKFRELIREIAALLAYEATIDLSTNPKQVTTPLAITIGSELQEKIGLVPILRAGLGMVEGVWDLMPDSQAGRIL